MHCYIITNHLLIINFNPLAKASFQETEKIFLRAALFGEMDPVTYVSGYGRWRYLSGRTGCGIQCLRVIHRSK